MRECFHNRSMAKSCFNSSLLLRVSSIVLTISESLMSNFILSIYKFLFSIDFINELTYPVFNLILLKIQYIVPAIIKRLKMLIFVSGIKL